MKTLVALLAALPLAAAAQTATDGRLYTPGPFDSIEISGSAVVRFAQGTQDQVFVEGDDDAQRAVEFDVRGNRLVIRPSGSWKFWSSQRARLQVTARDLKRLTISGAADVVAPQPVQVPALSVSISGAGLARFDRLQTEQLTFNVSGAGDGQMAGEAKALRVSVSGKGEFRGEQLHAERASVAVSGIGDLKLWVTQQLNVSVSGVGTVDYWGAPQVTPRTSGLARLNDRGAKPAP